MRNRTKGKILTVLALIIDVACPLAATALQFPVWIEQSAEATVSGMFLVMSVICVIPFFKHIKSYMRSPAIPVLWWSVFIIFLMLANIVNQVILICFVGGISNTVGAGIYTLGRRLGERPDKKAAKEKDTEE